MSTRLGERRRCLGWRVARTGGGGPTGRLSLLGYGGTRGENRCGDERRWEGGWRTMGLGMWGLWHWPVLFGRKARRWRSIPPMTR